MKYTIVSSTVYTCEATPVCLCLQVIHSSVVDTALVFPHKKGLPYKRALKSLMLEYLRKFIQNDIGESVDYWGEIQMYDCHI